MRRQLKPLLGRRWVFQAEVKRFGHYTDKRGTRHNTTLLWRVRRVATRRIVAHHIWLHHDLSAVTQPGEAITFAARVAEYLKGYRGGGIKAVFKPLRIDYCLQDFTLLEQHESEASCGYES